MSKSESKNQAIGHAESGFRPKAAVVNANRLLANTYRSAFDFNEISKHMDVYMAQNLSQYDLFSNQNTDSLLRKRYKTHNFLDLNCQYDFVPVN
jgi:hypothetical protein